ncbi:hypothetical protein BJX70DRAFT_354190 [Aspergillus crustosus]
MVLARGAQRFEPILSSVLGTPDILGRLAAMKLDQEVSSHEPSLRRCLGHHGVFKRCVTATEETSNGTNTTPAPSKKVSCPKPRRSSEGHSIRVHITGTIKGIIHRRSTPAVAPEKSNDMTHALSRVQAHATTTSSNTPSSAFGSARTFLGLLPFVRLKQRSSDKAVD